MKKYHSKFDENTDPLADEPTSPSMDEFSQLLNQFERQSKFERIQAGDKVTGRLVRIGEDTLFFDLGQRAEAVLEKIAFEKDELAKLKIGDEVPLYIGRVGANGIEVTRGLNTKSINLDALQDAQNARLPIEGKVTGENKGGYTVEISGGKAFVPFSQMDMGGKQNPADYIGKTLRFLVSRVSGRDIVLSRTALLKEEQRAEREQIIANLKEGDTRTGTVVNVEKFGAFVDIGGGIHGLVPVSELSWSRQVSPVGFVARGQSVQVKVLKLESLGDKPRILLSMKQCEQDPWENLVDQFAVGQTAKGKVTRLMTFGAFVELAGGVEGLLHISEMSAKRRVLQPGEIVKPGDDITVSITSIDRMQKRIGLSLKALQADELDAETKKKYLKDADDAEHRGVEFRGSGSGSVFADAFASARKK